jgi:hypothetical protein
MTHTVTISIGRNDGPLTRELGVAVPMLPHLWDAFQGSVTAVLTATYGTAHGVGEWDGIAEDTFLVIGQVENLEEVRAKLAALAAEYRQDAIGLVAQSGTDTEVRAA